MVGPSKFIIGKVVSGLCTWWNIIKLKYVRKYACFCTFKLSSLLLVCRNPKHRIVPPMLLSGSVVAAFDDVGVEHSDFDSIQGKA